MAEENTETGENTGKPETKEEKKARKAREKAEKKAAKAAAKAGTPAEGAEGTEAAATEGGEGAEAQPAPKKSKKLIIILAAVVLLVGGGVGAILSGGGDKGEVEETTDLLATPQTLYHDMDEFLVNLNNPGTQVSFLKAVITLELPNQLSLNEIQTKMPRIRDMFQVYLRELRSSDLQGSAGLQRLRTELLLRVNSVMEKGKVNNILFKEVIVQ